MKRFILLGTLALALNARASIPDSLAVRAILGEAANQPYAAKLAIACVIRNRGSLNGVFGVANERAQHCPSAVRADALQAWRESANADITHGSRYFGCPTDAPYFVRTLHMHAVLKIGDITFYKP